MTDDAQRAGWYPDPDGAAGERWWNGVGWSDTRRGGATPPANQGYTPPAAAQLNVSLPAASVPPVPVAPVPVPVVPVPPMNAAPPLPAPVSPPQRPDPYAPAGSRPSATLAADANNLARVGFILGIVSVFFNIAYVLAPAAILVSAFGISRARRLQAQGASKTFMGMAAIGLVTGIIGLISSVIQLIFFAVALSN